MDPQPSFNLEEFRIQKNSSLVPARSRKGSKKPHSGAFLKGPIPLSWLKAAACLPGRTLHIGIVLWFLVGVHKLNAVKFSYRQAGEFGIGRHAAYRGLTKLERAGLVTVHRHRGRSPVVKVLHV